MTAWLGDHESNVKNPGAIHYEMVKARVRCEGGRARARPPSVPRNVGRQVCDEPPGSILMVSVTPVFSDCLISNDDDGLALDVANEETWPPI